MKAIRALWSSLWGRGVSIRIEFNGLDGGNDKCGTASKPGCGKARKFHRRGNDHRFVEPLK